MLTEYRALSKIKEATKESDSRKDALSQEMSSFRQGMGLTEAGFQSYIKVCGHTGLHKMSGCLFLGNSRYTAVLFAARYAGT